jgi:pectin methylesterase-like acyl-CoA thioesterase
MGSNLIPTGRERTLVFFTCPPISSAKCSRVLLMYFYRLTAVALGLYTVSSVAEAATIRVPADQGTIQAAIDSARNGDVVLVLPGVYTENVRLEGKTITLASRFLNTRESKDIEKTVIDGAGKTAVEVKKVGPETRIVGLTIRNGDDGILCSSKIQILNNRIINNTDGIDYEGGGGICRSNLFQGNRDDGVDLDGS